MKTSPEGFRTSRNDNDKENSMYQQEFRMNPIFQGTLNWVEQELRNNRNDTVHDFLAYLAEQMIHLNKAKNDEVRGFLPWLEREIGCKIDELIGKTVLKDYHEDDIIALFAVLKRNKSKLAIDPTNRKIQESIEKHFEESMAVLRPLKIKIESTDALIDRIVYRLYGLSDEEIGIIEKA